MNAAPSDARPYTPWGAARALWNSRAPEVMLSGAAGTGKTRGQLEKLFFVMSKYPGSRGLIFRKRRKDLTESGLVTWEQDVLPARHASLGRIRRENRHSYPFPNGSVVVVGGLDDPSKVMSTQYDCACGLECRELEEADWESVSVRCRHGVMPYQQVLGDTNPDAPGHWIRRRAAAGRLVLLESRHEDNPAYYDRAAGAWNERGRLYVARLDTLTGVRRDRLRFGRWTQAEGQIYDGWDPAIHLVDPFPIPPDWVRYWSVDFGYTNPFVAQFWAQDPDGRLYLYRELYHTQRLVEDHARQIRALSAGDPKPRAIVCDHDAEDRATLERHLGLPTKAAMKDVSPGIQAVAARLRVSGDGKPRLMVFRDALVERDPALDDAKKPACLADEVEGYVWDTSTGRKKGDQPLKRDDHGCDCARYLCAELDLRAHQPYRRSEAPERTAADEAPAGVWSEGWR